MVSDKTFAMEGKEADESSAHDLQKLSVDEKKSLQEAFDIYNKYCIS